MTYNKDSFLAGIAVGKQLKGWAATDAPQIGPGYLVRGNLAALESHRPTDMPDPIIGDGTYTPI